MIKKYPAYKDSGIEWIGEIPTNWIVKRTKYIFSEVKVFSDSGGETLLSVSEYYGVAPRHAVIDEGDHLTRADSLVGYKKCNKKDLVMNIMLAWKRGLGISPVNGIVSPAYSVFRINSKRHFPQFYHYLLRTDIYTSEFKRNSTGVIDSRLRLYPDDFMRIYLVSPPLSEQQAIADYLDAKTALIDELIDKKRRQIELLTEQRQAVINQAVTKGLDPDVEMKDSGIEWLGEIPKHWEVKKIKFLLQRRKSAIKTGPFGSQLKGTDFQEQGIKVYNQRSVLDNDFEEGEIFISLEKYEELKAFEVFPDDILITTRGTIGKCAIFPHNAEKGVLHPCLIRVQLDQSKILNEYAIWYIQDTSFFEENVHYNSNATTIDVIYSDTLKEVQIPVPPIDEQQSILAFIRAESDELTRTSSAAEKQIQLLQEYRTALISEAVTGKIDVRKAG